MRASSLIFIEFFSTRLFSNLQLALELTKNKQRDIPAQAALQCLCWRAIAEDTLEWNLLTYSKTLEQVSLGSAFPCIKHSNFID